MNCICQFSCWCIRHSIGMILTALASAKCSRRFGPWVYLASSSSSSSGPTLSSQRCTSSPWGMTPWWRSLRKVPGHTLQSRKLSFFTPEYARATNGAKHNGDNLTDSQHLQISQQTRFQLLFTVQMHMYKQNLDCHVLLKFSKQVIKVYQAPVISTKWQQTKFILVRADSDTDRCRLDQISYSNFF